VIGERPDIGARVEAAVTPLLEAHGYELVLLEYVPRSRVLRFFIDHERGVNLADCTQVSHLIGDLLDAEGFSDLLPARYRLEVSSPGLDRPLVRPAHFRRFVGREVQVRAREPIDGRRQFRGRLLSADETGISMDCEGRTCTVAYAAVASARLVPDF
jgi:ribosome maturation factor RimP